MLETNRLVSILSVISKIFERDVFDQTERYLNEKKKKKNLLHDLQSGFRRSFSTDTRLIHLSDYIRDQMDKSNFVGMVLLDLQKASYTVDHSILIMKLEAMGFGNDIADWFSSYLSERKQLVDVNKIQSSFASIKRGVPQDSILGTPSFFNLYK